MHELAGGDTSWRDASGWNALVPESVAADGKELSDRARFTVNAS